MEPVHHPRSGEQRVGGRLELTITAPDVRAVTFRPRVLDLEPGRLIRWKGKLWIPGLFDGRHSLAVDPLDGGRSRFTTHEEVSGILVPALGKAMRASQQGFELMAEALSRRCADRSEAAQPIASARRQNRRPRGGPGRTSSRRRSSTPPK